MEKELVPEDWLFNKEYAKELLPPNKVKPGNYQIFYSIIQTKKPLHGAAVYREFKVAT